MYAAPTPKEFNVKAPLLPLFLLCIACDGGETGTDDTGEIQSNFSCAGDDDCLNQICQACVDECGGDCSVDDLYPPQYNCPGVDTFLVEDFCPDWTAE